MKRAWASLKRLEAAGRGSSESRALESCVLQALAIVQVGGFDLGSAEHTELLERMKQLGDLAPGAMDGEVAPSKEAMDAEFALVFPPLLAGLAIEGMAAYPGPMTREMLVQAHGHWREVAQHYAKAAALAPDPASALVCWSFHARHQSSNPDILLPRLPATDPHATAMLAGELRVTLQPPARAS